MAGDRVQITKEQKSSVYLLYVCVYYHQKLGIQFDISNDEKRFRIPKICPIPSELMEYTTETLSLFQSTSLISTPNFDWNFSTDDRSVG